MHMPATRQNMQFEQVQLSGINKASWNACHGEGAMADVARSWRHGSKVHWIIGLFCCGLLLTSVK